MGARLGGALRGCGLGLLAGGLWFLLEAVGNSRRGRRRRRRRTLGMIAALDLGLGGSRGARPRRDLLPRGGVLLGLAMGAAYGFMRVYEPPGMGAETVFVLVAAAALVGRRLDRPARRRRRASSRSSTRRCSVRPAVLGRGLRRSTPCTRARCAGCACRSLIALLPLLALLADWLIGLVVRRRGVRLGLELAAAAIALAVLGKPLSTAPLENRVVTAVPPPAATPDIFLVSLDTTRADHLSLYGYERPTSPNLEALRRGRAHLHAGALDGGVDAAGPRLDADRHVPEPSRCASRRRLAARASRSTAGATSRSRWPPTRSTLAEVLRDRGYTTGGFVANFSYLYRDFGMAQGFQLLRGRARAAAAGASAGGALRAALRARLLSEAVPDGARHQRRGARLARHRRRPAGRSSSSSTTWSRTSRGWRRRRTTAGCRELPQARRAGDEGPLHPRGEALHPTRS